MSSGTCGGGVSIFIGTPATIRPNSASWTPSRKGCGGGQLVFDAVGGHSCSTLAGSDVRGRAPRRVEPSLGQRSDRELSCRGSRGHGPDQREAAERYVVSGNRSIAANQIRQPGGGSCSLAEIPRMARSKRSLSLLHRVDDQRDLAHPSSERGLGRDVGNREGGPFDHRRQHRLR
jgi:hypothetical protein